MRGGEGGMKKKQRGGGGAYWKSRGYEGSYSS